MFVTHCSTPEMNSATICLSSTLSKQPIAETQPCQHTRIVVGFPNFKSSVGPERLHTMYTGTPRWFCFRQQCPHYFCSFVHCVRFRPFVL
eukprot:2162604-Amphidinium_carterae.1